MFFNIYILLLSFIVLFFSFQFLICNIFFNNFYFLFEFFNFTLLHCRPLYYFPTKFFAIYPPFRYIYVHMYASSFLPFQHQQPIHAVLLHIVVCSRRRPKLFWSLQFIMKVFALYNCNCRRIFVWGSESSQ